MNKKSFIRAIETYLPQNLLDNVALANEFPDWNVDKIFKKTGINKRFLSNIDEFASDLGFKAATKLFASGVCSPDEIEFLLFCTQSPDYNLPTTACILQDRLGIPVQCGALDFNLGCSGYVYGLSLAKGLIETGMVNNCLLITAETYSKYLREDDRSVRSIFGDGAAATFISSKYAEKDLIGPFDLGTDGSGYSKLIVQSSGMKGAKEKEVQLGLHMSGADIFTFTLQSVPDCLKNLLKKVSFGLSDFDYFYFHQANKFMLEALRDKCEINPAKFCINLENYGNTVSASIPMAISESLEFLKGVTLNRVGLVGFGVGYSWGSCVVDLTELQSSFSKNSTSKNLG